MSSVTTLMTSHACWLQRQQAWDSIAASSANFCSKTITVHPLDFFYNVQILSVFD
jgi:hypothetical protein